MKQKLQYILSLVCLSLFLAGCVSSCDPVTKRGRDGEFAEEFGFQPTQGINVLHCNGYQVGDCYGRFIVFTSDETNLQRIVTAGFTNATAGQIATPWGSVWRQHLEKSPQAPKWWRTPSTNKFRVYYKEPSRKDFGGSFHYFLIDESSQTVYSESAGWD